MIPELFHHSWPKIMAISTIMAATVIEMGSGLLHMFAETEAYNISGFEHFTVIGCFGLATLWLLREREQDKKDHKLEISALMVSHKNEIERLMQIHKEEISALLVELKQERDIFRSLSETVIKDNTAALEKNSQLTEEQNKFFQEITETVVSQAFDAGMQREHNSPRPKTSRLKLPTQ